MQNSLLYYINIEMIAITYYSEQGYREQYNRTIKTNKLLLFWQYLDDGQYMLIL